jgi:two-component system, LytTR family, sensor kinase
MNLRVSAGIRWRWIAFYVGAWTLVALVAAVQTYVSKIAWDHPVPARLALFASLVEWYVCALLSLGALALGERFPFQAGKGVRRFLLHAVASAVTVLACGTFLGLLLHGRWSLEGRMLTFGYVFRMAVLDYFPYNATPYWLVLLAQQGWHYYQQSRQRELQTSELKHALSQARLDALRMQLNPHFLFNTLHTISALIRDNPEAAERMLARLSDLLRVSLDRSDTQEVPLRQELAVLDRYLEIEQVRFEDHLILQREIAPEALEAVVPFLILQPLVENAIRHGIEAIGEKGRILLRARRRDGELELAVVDNGPGLPRAEDAPREGVGLANTRSRLAHLYGDHQRVELLEVPGGGLEARLTLPWRTAHPISERGHAQ